MSQKAILDFKYLPVLLNSPIPTWTNILGKPSVTTLDYSSLQEGIYSIHFVEVSNLIQIPKVNYFLKK